MTGSAVDRAIGETLQKTGALTPEQINQAVVLQAHQAAQGKPCALADILTQQGMITPDLQAAMEKKLRDQQGSFRQLGPYRLVRRLGQGAMGTVFLAEDTMLARQIALKVLPKAKSDDREFVARFKREATAAGKLNHVNIAGAYAVDEDQGYHYYAMEFCDGDPLSELLKKSGRLAEDKVLKLGIQMARGLQFAHEHGIIHRDIKPENAILTKDHVVKVLDMGLSKDLASDEGFQTMSGIAMGTPHYISPEQARGSKEVDGRTDIYSLGATLYHLATGNTPYNGPSAAVIMTKHLSDPLPDPRAINPALSDGMVHILTRAMAKAPADRYQSMDALLTDMELVLNGQEPASEGVGSARSDIAARSAMRLRRTTGPQEAVRTTGRHGAVRVTGRQQPIEGRSTTSARSFIDGRVPSGRQNGTIANPPSNKQKLFIALAGAGAGLVLLVALMMALRGHSDQERAEAGKPKEALATSPVRLLPDPSPPVLPPPLSKPITPPEAPVTATSAPTAERATPPTTPATEQTEYDPRAAVAQSRLIEIQSFAARHPEDPWSCAEMLKDLISTYRGMKATEEAQAFLSKLTVTGAPPAAHRNWHLEWVREPGTGSGPIGSLTTSLDGRLWVLSTHPPAEGTPLVFQRNLTVPGGKPILVFRVHGHENGDFDLQIEVDGKQTVRQPVGGKTWRTFSLDLTAMVGREVLVRVRHVPTGWNYEHGYWQAPDFFDCAPQGARPLGWAGARVLDGTKPVFLSNLEATEIKVGYGQFGRAGDLGYEGGRIVVDGVPAPNGLSTHPPNNGKARVAYTLGKRFSAFRAQVALNDTSRYGCATPITFVVTGDGRPLWTSQPISRSKQPQSVEVGLEGVETLELAVQCNGPYALAHAVWIEPQLLPMAAARSGGNDATAKQSSKPDLVSVEPVTPAAGGTQATPDAATPFAGFKDDLAKAEIVGAALLKDLRPFRLQPKDGKVVAVGTGTKNRVLEVKNGVLQIEQSLGGGKMVIPLSLSALDAQTRYELTSLGLPPGPSSDLKRAYAGLLMLQKGEGDISPRVIARYLDDAAKDLSLTDLVTQIRERLETAAAEGAAIKAWQRAEDFFERRSMREAKAAYDAFQKEFGPSKTAAANAELLKQRYEAIDAEFSSSRGLSLDLGGGVRMDFVLVRAGEFQMGTTGRPRNHDWQANEGPAHKVTITKPFYIGKYPVTVAQFARFVEATKYLTACEKNGNKGGALVSGKWGLGTGVNWRTPGFPQASDHPVVLVNWNDAQAFSKWASQQFGKEVRLPTEAQWEYAARGPLNLEYPFGNNWDGSRVNHKDAALKNAGCLESGCSSDNDGYACTSPVGKLNNASWCGAFDMVGNVWQPVQDYEPNYKAEPQIDPHGPAGGLYRIFRGGNWKEEAEACRTTIRARLSQTSSATHQGFRVVIVAGQQ